MTAPPKIDPAKRRAIEQLALSEEGRALVMTTGGLVAIGERCNASQAYVSQVISALRARGDLPHKAPSKSPRRRVTGSTSPRARSIGEERAHLEAQLHRHVEGIVAAVRRLGQLGAVEELRRRTKAAEERLLAAPAAPPVAVARRAARSPARVPSPEAAGDAVEEPAEEDGELTREELDRDFAAWMAKIAPLTARAMERRAAAVRAQMEKTAARKAAQS